MQLKKVSVEQVIQEAAGALAAETSSERQKYVAKLIGKGFRTASAIAAYKDGLSFEQRSGLAPGEADVIWNTARELVDSTPGINDAQQPSLSLHGWEIVKQCETLQTFVDAIPHQRDPIQSLKPGTVITLPNGAVWLGIGQEFASSYLYILPDYIDLLDARDQYIQYQGWQKGCQTNFTGTPGIGKSHLAGLVVARTLLDGKRILLENVFAPPGQDLVQKRQYFWLSLEGKVYYTSDIGQALNSLLEHKDKAIYVTDGCVPSIGRSHWDGHTVAFSSPQRGLQKTETKGGRVLWLYVDPINRDDMLAMGAALFQGLTPGEIKEWYVWGGGSARITLKRAVESRGGLEEYKTELLDLVTPKSPGNVADMALAEGHNTYIAGSDKIFHWFACPPPRAQSRYSPNEHRLRRFTSKRVRFATPAVRDMVIGAIAMAKMADIAMACLHADRPTTYYCLELLALRYLQMGAAKLTGALLPEDAKSLRLEFELTLPHAKLRQYVSPTDAATAFNQGSGLRMLLVPFARNEPAIDAMSSPVLYWQITSAKRHDIVRSAVTQMNHALGPTRGGRTKQWDELRPQLRWLKGPPMRKLTKPLLCFLVTPSRYDMDYSSTQLYVGGTSCAQGECVHQCVVKLPLDDMTADCRDPDSVRRFKHQVEEAEEAELADEKHVLAQEAINSEPEAPLLMLSSIKTRKASTAQAEPALEAKGLIQSLKRAKKA